MFSCLVVYLPILPTNISSELMVLPKMGRFVRLLSTPRLTRKIPTQKRLFEKTGTQINRWLIILGVGLRRAAIHRPFLIQAQRCLRQRLLPIQECERHYLNYSTKFLEVDGSSGQLYLVASRPQQPS